MKTIITDFNQIPQFTPSGSYSINIHWAYLLKHLEDWSSSYTLILDPDFQRAHVWTEIKQIEYVEFVLRGGRSARTIYFNSPGWGKGTKLHPNPTHIYLVDGKQRLKAVQRFLNNEITAFGTKYKDFTGRLRIHQADFVFHVNDLDSRTEMLQWYLDLNAGGVIHTAEELDKVRKLLKTENRKEEKRLQNLQAKSGKDDFGL